MIFKALLGAIAIVAMFSPPQPPQQSKTITFMGGDYKVTYDPSVTSETEVRHWIQLSPEMGGANGYLVPEELELCDAIDPAYKRPCGSRDPLSPNFWYNAEVNLRKIRERILDLNEANYPEQLTGIVKYLREIQQFWLWKEQSRLKSYQTWDVAGLEVPYGQIDPKRDCSSVVTAIEATQDRREEYQLSQHDWWKCVWDIEYHKIGDYPTEQWKKFLAQRRIQEKVASQGD